MVLGISVDMFDVFVTVFWCLVYGYSMWLCGGLSDVFSGREYVCF
jgi:hypothetical protein